MSYNPAHGFPRVVPELVYRDLDAAVEWLGRVFGFEQDLLFTLENGTAAHADLSLEGGIVMGAVGDERYRGPAALKQACCNLVFFVSDVDRHFRHAREAGAKIVSEPADKPWGLRQYRVEDLEGHLWEFTQHLRDVAPESWGAKVRPQAAKGETPSDARARTGRDQGKARR